MALSFTTDSEAAGLCAFVDASPSPFHACAQAADLLEAAGFSLVTEAGAFPAKAGRYYLIRGGSMRAWSPETASRAATPVQVLGAHQGRPSRGIQPRPHPTPAGAPSALSGVCRVPPGARPRRPGHEGMAGCSLRRPPRIHLPAATEIAARVDRGRAAIIVAADDFWRE